MVITYNPSHSNINSEVNAPFKMLSLMLRFLDNETKPTNKRPLRQPIEDYDEDEEGGPRMKANPNSAFGTFAMPRQGNEEAELAIDSGARMDTYNDDENSDNYGSEGEDGHQKGFGDLAEEDRLSVNLDDVVDDESDDDAIDLGKKAGVASNGNTAATKVEEGKGEEAINTTNGSGDSSDQNQSTGGSSGSGGNGSTGNLFAVGESTDKGLADMETGSEVYMSELLVSII